MQRIETVTECFRYGSQSSYGACYSAAQFMMGNALHNCYFEDSMGKVYSNLSFVWSSPSSTFKTPLIKMIREIWKSELKNRGIRYKSKFTTEGLMNSLNSYRVKFEGEDGELNNETPKFKCLVIRDEASNLAKESKGNGRAANIWEFLSETFDGQISPYDTVRGKDQQYPDVWFSFWFSSTLSLFQHLSDDFWEQGYAFRCLFIKPEKKEFEPMGNGILREEAIKNIATQMEPLYEIQEATATEEWWEKYNEFVKPIVERGNEEIDKLNTAENTDIEDKAEKKYPEIVIKLSMIQCASRDGWKEHEGRKILVMELQDIERAIVDLQTYKDNFISAYASYQFKKKTGVKMEKVDTSVRKMVLKIINEAPEDQRYSYRVEEGEDKKLHSVAYKSEEGKYVTKTYFYRKTNWVKPTMITILETMYLSEELDMVQVESDGTYKKTTLIGVP